MKYSYTFWRKETDGDGDRQRQRDIQTKRERLMQKNKDHGYEQMKPQENTVKVKWSCETP